MRNLKLGWYRTSLQGPMVLHVQGTIVNTVWDPRMQAVLPQEKPEGPNAVKIEFETDHSGKDRVVPPPTFASADQGVTWVEIGPKGPSQIQYSGTGGIRVGKVRHNAEVFTETWLDVDPDIVDQAAGNGVAIPCQLSADQPTHRVLWRPFGKPVSVTPVRVEGVRAYAHTEWAFRAHPKAPFNWEEHNGKWWWRDPQGRLYPTPANANGILEIVPL